MRVVLIVVAVVVALEAFALTVFPEGVKRIIGSLSPRELQVVGVIAALVALALICYLVMGA